MADQQQSDKRGRPGRGTRRPTLRQRVRYSFDNALSRGPAVVIGWLGLLTLAIVVVAALVLSILQVSGINGDDQRLGLIEDTWQAALRLLDPGTFADDAGWSRPVMLLITLTGIFLVGSLIGLIANAVDQSVESLRKGRSTVLEHDHTLILGWSDRVAAIVRELIIANESRKRAAVVILADVDKTEMEDSLRDEIDDFKTTRLVCRRGSISSMPDLALVNAAGARSIVVVGGNDAAAVKAVLAVQAGQAEDDAPPVVVEIVDPDVARSLRSLFGDAVTIVSSDSVVAELTAQACRQRGLSQVFHELLDFDGDEIYFAPFPDLVGSTYGHAQLCFDTCSLMGVFTTDGTVILNPPADRIIAAGEELIGIASDDSTFLPTGYRPPTANLQPVDRTEQVTANRLILVGWSQFGPRVVAELDEFLGPETTLEIIIDPASADEADVRASLTVHNMNIEVSAQSGGPEEIAAFAARQAFHEVIVLGRREDVSREDADARTLMTLVAFQQLVRAGAMGDVRVVAELLDQRHVPLALATGADDFIVSDELTSLMIAQLSERASLSQVFDDLFDPQGCMVEVIPAARYGGGEARCFGDIVAAATAVGHSAIGFRRAADGVVTVNPAKQAPLAVQPEDGIVVLR